MKYTGPLNFILRENVMWEWTDATELYHYGKGHDDNPPGRGSGRYPWGSGEKNANLGERANKTARSISKSLKDYAVKRRRNKNLQKARTAKAEKAAKAKEEEEKKQKRKEELERILKTGSVKDILDNKNEFSNQELNDAFNRLRNEENLKSLLPKDKSTLDKVMDVKNNVDKVLGVVDTGINTWNKVAKISNSLMGTSIKTINDQQNAQKKELTRVTKEAKKILEQYKDMALDSINTKELAELAGKLQSLNKIESYSK